MRVAVVGMGLAGLRTMMLLQKAGIEVHGYEARQRVGGRLKTVQTEQSFYEAGGEWIDADHHRVIALLREMGGEPVADRQYPGKVVIGGQKFVEDDYGDPYGRELDQVEEEADRLALDLDDSPWHNVLSSDLDGKTLGEWLDAQAGRTSVTRRILECVYRSDEGDDPSEVGLLGWLCGRLAGMDRTGGEMSSYRFPNGAQRFCEAIASRVGSIHMGHPLHKVLMEGDRVGLIFRNEEPSWFDRVVLALPAGCLQDIEFEPGISEAKREAFENVRMSRTIKIALHFDKVFWTGSPRTLTDGALQQIWSADRTPNSELINPSATLLAYLGGEKAIELALMGAEEAGRLLVDELEAIHPGAKQHFLKATLHDWVHDDFSGGGFFSLPPGYVLDHYEALVRTEGPLHFAGDFGGSWIGTMEGALESAERVAEEIKRAAHVH